MCSRHSGLAAAFGSCALGALSLFSLPAHAQVTLDFNSLPNPINSDGDNSQGFSVTQNGFTVTNTSKTNPLESVAPNGNSIGYNYTGSVALYTVTDISAKILTQNNGNLFNLNSVDLANVLLQSVVPQGATVIFTGNKAGGATVTKTYTHGTNNSLETLPFGSDFTNLTSVNFGSGGNYYQFDNIVVTPTAVPEPGSIALLMGMSAVGAALLRRRKQACNAA